MPVEFEPWGRQVRLVPHRRRGKADVRVSRQQRLAAVGTAAGDRPGVAAFELRQAVVGQGLFAQAGQGIEVFPVGGGQGQAVFATFGQHALGLPVEVEDVQVLGAQLIAHVGQQRFGAKGRGEAVGHVAGDAHGVFNSERALGNAQYIELQGPGVAVLVGVDPVQVGLHGHPGRGVWVLLGHVGRGALADAQAAHQLVGVQQLRPQHLSQLTPGEAPHELHLKQPILGMDITKGAVQVGFVFGADMRHTAFVVAHRHRALQPLQLHRALAGGLLAVEVATRDDDRGDDQ